MQTAVVSRAPLAVRGPEARKLIGSERPISVETLWRLWKNREIDSFKIGTARFYTVASIERLVRSRVEADVSALECNAAPAE